MGTAESDSDGCSFSSNAIPFEYKILRSEDGTAFHEAAVYKTARAECAVDVGSGSRIDHVTGWPEITRKIKLGFNAALNCRASCSMGNYVFPRRINVFGTACGDGRKSPSEACDDGNSVSGDGCSEVCKVEDGW